jgi:hypothetical protein
MRSRRKTGGRRKSYGGAFRVFKLRGCRSRQWSGVAQESVPFYSALAPVNHARNMQIYLFTLMIASHNGKTSKGQNVSFTLASVSVGRPWEFRSPFSPCKESVVSSAHLEGRTTLTDEGLLLGKMVFGSVLPRPARLLVSAHVQFRIYEGSMQ